MASQRLVIGVAGELSYLPIEGRPDDAAELSVYDGTAEWAGWTAGDPVVLQTYQQALTATAEKRARSVAVTSTGLRLTQRVSLRSHKGQREIVGIDGVYSGGADLDRPIPWQCLTTGSASYLEDPWLIAAISADDLTTVTRNLRAVWTYTVDSVEYRKTSFFDVVRQGYDVPVGSEEISEIYEPWPDLVQSPSRTAALARGARSELESIVDGWGKEVDLIRDPYELVRAVALICVRNVLGSSASIDEKRLAHVEKRLVAELGRLQEKRLWYDADDDLVAGPTSTDGGSFEDQRDGESGLSETDGMPLAYARVS